MTGGEEEALLEHLRDPANQEALAQHIRAGGTYNSYVSWWRTERDAAAAAKEISPELVAQILALPVPRWDPAETVRDYLVALLAELWASTASPKYGMTGSSDWRYDLYEPMLAAGIIRGWRAGYGVGYREDGTEHPEDRARARKLIDAAIRSLAGERVSA